MRPPGPQVAPAAGRHCPSGALRPDSSSTSGTGSSGHSAPHPSPVRCFLRGCPLTRLQDSEPTLLHLPPARGTPSGQARDTCCSGLSPKPFGESIFIGAGAVPGPLAEQARGHAPRGGGTPAPPGEPSRSPPAPAWGSTEGPRPPFPHPHRSHTPSESPGEASPPGGVARLSSHPHTQGLAPRPPLVCGGTNSPGFWAELQIREVSRTHRGISAPEVQRKLKGHLCHLVPARTAQLALSLAAPSALGQLPACGFLPLLPPESPLRGRGPAGRKPRAE